MNKLILTDIKHLEVSHVKKAIQAMKRQGWPPPYTVVFGFGVKLGPGTHKYMLENEVVMR